MRLSFVCLKEEAHVRTTDCAAAFSQHGVI